MKDFLKGRKMRTILRGKYSSWKEVTSGVPQGSVLAPIMFLVFINDINDNIGSEGYMNMFADDAKMQRKIITENSCWELQNDLAKLYKWSQKWQMEFNGDKCHVIKFGKSGGEGRHAVSKFRRAVSDRRLREKQHCGEI